MSALPLTLRTGPREDALHAEIRSWIATHDPGPPPSTYDDYIAALVTWQARLWAQEHLVCTSHPRHCHLVFPPVPTPPSQCLRTIRQPVPRAAT